jgi:indolepyruvate ferredoxin oxidoreductase beta subunit
MRYDLLLCGVGGQGIITLSEIVATAALSKDIKTIVTQEKGLAQRGGSVKAHIRMGDVFSPTMPKRSAHGLLSLEITETLGYLDFVNQETVKAVSDTVIASGDQNDSEKDIHQKLKTLIGTKLMIVDARKRAIDLGVAKGVNIFMLGVLFGMDARINELISSTDLEEAIRAVVRHKIEDNINIFRKGIEHGQKSESN